MNLGPTATMPETTVNQAPVGMPAPGSRWFPAWLPWDPGSLWRRSDRIGVVGQLRWPPFGL